MATAIRHHCFHHRSREAVARCPECEKFYCRECVTEHDGRVICAGCLAKSEETGEKRTAPFLLVAALQAGVGFFVIWLVFYWVARLLIAIPPSFHEGLGLN